MQIYYDYFLTLKKQALRSYFHHQSICFGLYHCPWGQASAGLLNGYFGGKVWAPVFIQKPVLYRRTELFLLKVPRNMSWGIQAQEFTGGKWFQFASQTVWERGEKTARKYSICLEPADEIQPRHKSSSPLHVQQYRLLWTPLFFSTNNWLGASKATNSQRRHPSPRAKRGTPGLEELHFLVIMLQRNIFSADSGKHLLPKSKLIHCYRNVPWLWKTPVGVMVIHWNEVHIAKHKAVVVIVLQGFLKANVQELSTIEHGFSSLVQTQKKWYQMPEGLWTEHSQGLVTCSLHVVHSWASVFCPHVTNQYWMACLESAIPLLGIIP